VLRELGIARVGDVLLFSEEILTTCFGSWGRRLYRGATGEDAAPVRSRPAVDERFIVEELLEPDRVQRGLLESILYRLAERLGERLRAERLRAGSLNLEVRHADGMRARGTARPGSPTSDDLCIFEAARSAFARVFTRRVRVRRMLLSARRLEPEPVQLEMFTAPDDARAERMQRLRGALDRLRSAFPEGVAPAFGRAVPALLAGRPESAHVRAVVRPEGSHDHVRAAVRPEGSCAHVRAAVRPEGSRGRAAGHGDSQSSQSPA
jgi:DNA polymerase-4